MTKHLLVTRLLATRLLAMLGLLSLWQATPFAAEVKLRILETTDLHMNLLSYDYYQLNPLSGTGTLGLAATASLIKAARAENANSLLFDDGDATQGDEQGDGNGRSHGARSGKENGVAGRREVAAVPPSRQTGGPSGNAKGPAGAGWPFAKRPDVRATATGLEPVTR